MEAKKTYIKLGNFKANEFSKSNLKIKILFLFVLFHSIGVAQVKFDSCVVYQYNEKLPIKDGKLPVVFDKIKNDSVKRQTINKEICDKLSTTLHRAKPAQMLIGGYPNDLVYITCYSFGKGHDFVLGCYQDMIVGANKNIKYLVYNKEDKKFIEELFQNYKYQ